MTKLGAWLRRVSRTAGPVLVATDFDGTLATVAGLPGGVLLDVDTRALLRRIASRARLAVLTGRRARDIVPHVAGIAPVWVVAEHGAEVIAPGEQSVPREPLHETRALDRSAQELARVFPGVHVELKTTSVAVHYRQVDPALRNGVIDGFHLACVVHGATELHGRCVVEGRFSRENKGTALARILAQLPEGTPFLYAGDDTTDEPALALATEAENGLSFYVRSDERPRPSVVVDATLAGPAEWMTILESLASALESARRWA